MPKYISPVALLFAFVTALAASALPAEARTFNNPRIGGKVLDGCYSWPGPCKSRRQANAFCRRKGYARAADFETTNSVGAFQTKRLGDGGVCTASCTVMEYVVCERGYDEDDDGGYEQ